LQQIFTLTYKAEVGNGLTEYEYDHIYLGHYDGPIEPNAAEVKSYEFVFLTDLQNRLSSHPEKFTPWLRIALPQFMESIAAKS
jgi:isopentenyl-diphosphate delta-isomerase